MLSGMQAWKARLVTAALMAANMCIWAYVGRTGSAVFFFVLTILTLGQSVGAYRSRPHA